MSRIAGLALVAVLMVLVAAFPARAQVPDPPKTPVAEGTGGSAATVDPLATQAAIDTLRSGGNAVDAAVAAAGVLGVVEPFSCGIGGGGFMVVYSARNHKVDTIDSREEAPAGMTETSFLASDGTPLPFAEARVGGLSVGVPGTVSGWETALNRYGTRRLSLAAAARRADRPPRLHDRRHLQRAGRRQRRPLRRLPRLGGSVPDARRCRQARRLGPGQPRPRAHLRADRPQSRPLLPRRDRARHLADRAAPAGGRAGRRRRPPDDPRGLDDGRATSRSYDAIRRKPTRIRLPRPRHLRHGARRRPAAPRSARRSTSWRASRAPRPAI